MEKITTYDDDHTSCKNKLRQAQLVMLKILKVVDEICQKHKIKYWLDGGTALGAVRHQGFIPWDDDIDICMLRKEYDRFLQAAEKELPNNLFLQVFQNDLDYILYWSKIRDKNSTIIEPSYEKARFHKGIGIDIFPCDFFPNNRFITGLEKNIAKAFRYRTKNFHKNMGFLEELNCAVSKLLCMIIPLNLEKLIFRIFRHLFRKSESWIGYGIGTPFPGRYKKDTIFPLGHAIFEGALFPIPNKVEKYLRNLYGDYERLPAFEDRKPHSVKIEVGVRKSD